MKIELANCNNVTADKVEFIEKQAVALFGFVMQSRELLTKEAHTTLNWIFAIILGSSGYAYKLLDAPNPTMWLVCPLVAVSAAAALQGLYLFRGALRNVPVLPIGNDPKNLMTDVMLAYEVHWMKLAETAQLQERIDAARIHNARVGDAVNSTRWLIASLPVVALITAMVSRWVIVALG